MFKNHFSLVIGLFLLALAPSLSQADCNSRKLSHTAAQAKAAKDIYDIFNDLTCSGDVSAEAKRVLRKNFGNRDYSKSTRKCYSSAFVEAFQKAVARCNDSDSDGTQDTDNDDGEANSNS